MPVSLDSVSFDTVYAVGVVAIGVVPLLPQLARLARTGDPTGLSLPALLAGLVNYTAWTYYLAGTDATGLLVGNVLAGLVWVVVTGLAVRGLAWTRACVVPGLWAVVLLAVVALAPALLGGLLGLGSLLVFVPQAVGVWRAPSLSGISPLSWWLLLAQGLVWFGESLPGLLVGGLVFGVVCVASSISVLCAVSVRTPALVARAEQVAVPEPVLAA
ncbi:MAG: hypothetical protein ABF306_17070 [Nocardioides marinisabuli]|uniref:hypothetical protein n=1 Tax=Nocardioides marinisabuli TaxID=419476 RepID=UPI003219D0CD